MTSEACARWASVALLAAFCAGVPVMARGQDSKSAPLAKELTTRWAERRVDVFAVQDPSRPGFFVAVRAYPGVQLLVVGGKSTALDYMKYQLDRKDYGEAYSALHSSTAPDTKLFVHDMGCDGLTRESDQVDVVHEKGADQIVFDRAGKASGLSRDAYNAKLRAIDAEYAALLDIILKAIRPSAGGLDPP
jgi:hypothetical protein